MGEDLLPPSAAVVKEESSDESTVISSKTSTLTRSQGLLAHLAGATELYIPNTYVIVLFILLGFRYSFGPL